jgi:glycosyltransferase involved in cell wall biosynthesis
VEVPAEVDAAAFRARHGLGDAPLVAFLGRITPRKRVDTLLQAFALLPAGTRLAIAGNAPGGELTLPDGVLRLPQMEGAERFGLLAAADAVAYPGEHEVFGLVAFEALACGAPVVVADDSGCAEIVSAVGGGLRVRAGDAPALAAALRAMLLERDRFRDEARKAGAAVRARFSPDEVARKICDVYAELAQPSPERPRA